LELCKLFLSIKNVMLSQIRRAVGADPDPNGQVLKTGHFRVRGPTQTEQNSHFPCLKWVGRWRCLYGSFPYGRVVQKKYSVYWYFPILFFLLSNTYKILYLMGDLLRK
jgi:hypothetical protein